MSYAGVLPFAVDAQGEIWILLGQEHQSDNARASLRWSDFGGHVERGEPSIRAAAREAFEEAMGLFGSAPQVEHQLILQRARQIETKNKRGVHFLLRIPLNETLPRAFNAFYHYAQSASLIGQTPLPAAHNGFWEKVRAGWFRLRTVEQDVPLRHEFLLDLPALRAALKQVVAKRT